MTDDEAERVLGALAGVPYPWVQPGVSFECGCGCGAVYRVVRRGAPRGRRHTAVVYSDDPDACEGPNDLTVDLAAASLDADADTEARLDAELLNSPRVFRDPEP